MGKVITLISGNDPSHGGGGHSRYVATQARASFAAGYEPHIFCAASDNRVVRTEFGFVHRAASPFRPFRHLMVIAHARYVAASLERFLLERQGPHLIHSSGVWARVGAMVATRLRHRGHKVIHVATVYDVLLHEARAKLRGVDRAHGIGSWLVHWIEFIWIKLLIDRGEGRNYHRCERIIVNYESVRRLLFNAYELRETVRTLPYTSFIIPDGNAAEESAIPPGAAPLIVCVSRHDPRKGVDVLLRALAQLCDAGVPFRACLVGNGKLLVAHRRLQQQLGLDDCVVIPGFVPDPMVYLKKADVFVLPSLEEGSGSMSLIEALEAGVAVIATAVDGIPEDLTAEENALLVPPNDAAALSAALQRILADNALRSRLAQNARALFAARFLPERFSEALRSTYEELGFH